MGKLVFKNIRKYIFKTGDKSLNKLFRDEVNTNSKNYFTLENLAEGNYFYKYFPLGNAIKCLMIIQWHLWNLQDGMMRMKDCFMKQIIL